MHSIAGYVAPFTSRHVRNGAINDPHHVETKYEIRYVLIRSNQKYSTDMTSFQHLLYSWSFAPYPTYERDHLAPSHFAALYGESNDGKHTYPHHLYKFAPNWRREDLIEFTTAS